jgi:hypothetical protein
MKNAIAVAHLPALLMSTKTRWPKKVEDEEIHAIEKEIVLQFALRKIVILVTIVIRIIGLFRALK